VLTLLLLSACRRSSAVNRGKFFSFAHIIPNQVQKHKVFIKFPRNTKKLKKTLAFF